MATTDQFKINGVIDTSKNVLDNLNELANVSGCYLTWDPSQGKWIVILNTNTSSVKTFNDSNIIGEINVGGTGVNELYNSVIATFPNKDTRDTVDVVQLTIPAADRFEQEIDNVLNLSIPIVNEPVQAAYIASRELKQSRLDKLIEFRANFEANTIKAGDVIAITNTALDFNERLFRVIQIDEEDEESGNLIFSITAQEYDPNIYDPNSGITGGLTYEYRSNFTGIKSKLLSEELDLKDNISAGKQIGGLLAANAALGLINSLFSVDEETGAIINEGKFADPDIQNAISSVAKPAAGVNSSVDDLCSGSPVTISVGHDCSSCFFDNPQFEYSYTITGVTAGEVDVPLTGTLTTTGTTDATLVVTPTVTTEKTMTITVGSASTVVTVVPPLSEYVQNVAAVPSTIQEGESSTVTITTVGYANGTTLSYNIYGNGTPKMTAPATSGTVTVNNNTATLTIVTEDDEAYDSSKSISVFVGSSLDNPCAITNNQADITVTNNLATGPTSDLPPSTPKPGDFQCEYVEVPIMWCGTFDVDTQYLKSIASKKTAFLPVATTGGVAVPTSVSVTNPGEASAAISIDSTVNVDSSASAAGAQIDVITTFGTLPSGGAKLLTGTTTTFKGYWD